MFVIVFVQRVRGWRSLVVGGRRSGVGVVEDGFRVVARNKKIAPPSAETATVVPETAGDIVSANRRVVVARAGARVASQPPEPPPALLMAGRAAV